MDTPESIAIFGGSFDPIHKGHIKLLETVSDSLSFDRILLVPCKQSPHKNAAPQATDAQRLEMCRLATQHLSLVKVNDYEIKKNTPSYSWMTVRHLQEEYPGCEFTWILGSDQWDKLDSWSRFDELRHQLRFLVVERQSSVTPKEGVVHSVLEFNTPISSTQIREELSLHNNSELTPLPVLDYIKAQQLYQ